MIVFLLGCYLVFFVFLIFRLTDIKKRPQKYNAIPGYEEYKKSKWYWPPKKDYGKTDPPDYSGVAGIVPFFVFLACSLISFDLVASFSRPALPHDDTTIRFCLPGICLYISYFLLFAYSAVLSEYLIMFSKRPMAICCNLHQIFRKDDRSDAWLKMTRIVLVATIIVCPFHLFGAVRNAYADNERIIYRNSLLSSEKEIRYKDIENVVLIYNEKGYMQHCYLQSAGGEKIDISGASNILEGHHDVISFIIEKIPSERIEAATSNNTHLSSMY